MLPICRRTARAEDDLIEIWLHIAADNPTAADQMLDRLSLAEQHLTHHPALGPARSDIAPEMRMYIVGHYLLLYRQIADGVEIVRVTHGARDISNLPMG
ncbi:MAG: type II toxin-antitoxin system RelE/ParE family toxin [Acetobacteraceae bacterium]|nr:type II toxin-antitoxin system RelE/ParE family toxin [Acetobacteraceae bacterium]